MKKTHLTIICLLLIMESSFSQAPPSSSTQKPASIMMGVGFLTNYSMKIELSDQYKVISKDIQEHTEFERYTNQHIMIAADVPLQKKIFLSTEVGTLSTSSKITLSYQSIIIQDGYVYGIENSILTKHSNYFSIGLGYVFRNKIAKNNTNWHSNTYLKARLDFHSTKAYFDGQETSTIDDKGLKTYKSYTEPVKFGNQGLQFGSTLILGKSWNYKNLGLWTELRYQNMFLGPRNNSFDASGLNCFALNIGTSIIIPGF